MTDTIRPINTIVITHVGLSEVNSPISANFLHLSRSASIVGYEVNSLIATRVHIRRDCKPDVGRCSEIHGHHDLSEHAVVSTVSDYRVYGDAVEYSRPEYSGWSGCNATTDIT